MMENLETKIQADIMSAMLKKDTVTLSALRAVKTAILNEKSNGAYHELSDADVIKLILKQIKQREEAEEIYRANERNELADNEKGERLVLEKYVPKMLSEEELKNIVDALVTELNATTIKDMGKVMGELNKRYAGQIDGRVASTVVKNRLVQ